MSVSYWAEVVVGLPIQDMEEEIIDKIMSYQYSEQGIEPKSPHYDGDDAGLFGITVKSCEDYSYSEMDFDKLALKINEARYTFKEHIGLEPKVYLTTRGG